MSDPVVLLSSGDVVGPNAATDGTMVLFDGTSGKKVKGNNAVVTVQALALLDDNTPAENRNTIGLGNVDNTSDLNKPVSTAQAAAIEAARSLVVGYPVVTGYASATPGSNVVLTALIDILLFGGAIVNFTWTLPDGSKVVTPATGNSASLSVAIAGAIGAQISVSVIATDNLGNSSKATVRVITITNHIAPTAPTTITVNATIYQNSTGNTLSITGSTASDGATIKYSLSQSGAVAVTFSKTSNINDGEVVTFSAPQVSIDTPITITATAIDSLGGVGEGKNASVTIAAVPSVAGVPFGGGYYVGRFTDMGLTFALVMAGKAAGESGQYYMYTGGTAVPDSETNGPANTNLMVNNGYGRYPAAEWCKALRIGGYADWYLPSLLELEMAYRYFKPDTTSNSSAGQNANSIPPGAAYTGSNPVRTTNTLFKTGGAEALLAYVPYWTSTQTTVYDAYGIMMNNGAMNVYAKSANNVVRAFRRIQI